MKITIDRIENGIAVVELLDGQTVNMPCALFPEASEGDVYSIEKNTAETEAAKKRIEGKMNRLFVN